MFEDGKPTGEYEDFMTGFVVSDDEVWGRPVGVAVAKDGALIVTEDGSGTIWRVTYDAGRPDPDGTRRSPTGGRSGSHLRTFAPLPLTGQWIGASRLVLRARSVQEARF